MSEVSYSPIAINGKVYVPIDFFIFIKDQKKLRDILSENGGFIQRIKEADFNVSKHYVIYVCLLPEENVIKFSEIDFY